MKIAIMGAGIGGLTLGIALRRRGHDVVLLEKRKSFAPEGAGVVLGPNVMSAVSLLGLHEPILARGRAVQGMNITDQRGKLLGRSQYSVAGLPLPGVAMALRLTPASVNDKALRRIVTDMPGVPIA
jgi:2-polyprenyl-6-methoxyphenol hydroxylase-like FAD-dependent oxidoreductase